MNYFEKLRYSIQQNDKDPRKEVIQFDLSFIFEYMDNFPSDHFIQESCCLALRKYTEIEKKIPLNFQNLNPFDLIIKAMFNFPFTKYLQLQCLLIFINIGKEKKKEKEINKEIVFEAILSSMINFYEYKQIMDKGTEALEALGMKKKEIMKKFKAKKKIEDKKDEKLFELLKKQYQNSKHNTPIHYLCRNKTITLDMIKYFIGKGSNFNLEGGVKQIIQKINQKINQNINNKTKQNKKFTPLVYLCLNSSITRDIIRFLITKHEYFKKITPLDYLFSQKPLPRNVIEFFIKKGLNLISEDNTPIHYLFKNGTITLDMIKYFIRKGYNLNMEALTPLTYLCLNKSITKDIIQFMISSGFSFNLQDDSLVHYLCRNQSITFEIIQLLTSIGANFNLNGWTPLHDLCRNESITKEIIELLCNMKGDFNIQYQSPLHLLCQNNSITSEMIRILIYNDANFNLEQGVKQNKTKHNHKQKIKIKFWTPLHYLCQNPSITDEMLLLLKETNANFDLKAIDQLSEKTPRDLLPQNYQGLI
ncbi:ankyrin repeat ph and sec7 domain containing protein secg-related [Anaeramoeba ignava]|uniref:Ankyrin repeat ph and sec7 domain containing protein secg-related n=1 Tax=Anaeramoeba ignava TaxID=1746090 RepID=A0A9Q0LJ92_ANAIG|nr:ankyrin repeat ph and sec7 domain containing protein secg-related [Anaeramoeba ignava]